MFRSPFLAWSVALGPEASPDFMLHWACVQHQVWRLRHRTLVPSATSRSLTQFGLAALLAEWQWQEDGLGRFHTPDGYLHLGWDGPATIRALAIRSWHRWLASRDNRLIRVTRMIHPCLLAWNLASGGQPGALRAALGAWRAPFSPLAA